MKVSYSWLKEYVAIDCSAEELAQKMSASGIETCLLKSETKGLEKVFTTRIEQLKKHPNADKLSLCQVTDLGETIQIVCGADNMQERDIVALARVGADLPCGVKIKKAKIRGETSCGMLCSASELNFGQEAEGIIILPQQTALGIPLAQALNLDQPILEFEITPNRGDCLSLFGLAREIAAISGKTVKQPQLKSYGAGKSIVSGHKNFSLEVQDFKDCPRYCAAIVNKITVAESPKWLKEKLASAAIRSINNIVDITNFVMLETGNPLHAFDLKKIKGNKIIVRRAEQGEQLLTLDKQQRKLVSDDLVIADQKRAIALAGVMGGAETEISESTTDILIEGAIFDPILVRRTAQRLALHSESSYRFERHVDKQITAFAVSRAADLIGQLANGQAAPQIIQQAKDLNQQQPEVLLREEMLNRVLGVEISSSQIAEILRNLNIEVSLAAEGKFSCKIPSWRENDLIREYDLIEEVGRIYGLSNIPSALPLNGAEEILAEEEERLSDTFLPLLSARGFCEAINYSFYSAKEFEQFASERERERRVELANPLGKTQAVMRNSLLPGLIKNLKTNLSFRRDSVALFERGRVYLAKKEGLPEEKNMLGLLLFGRKGQTLWQQEDKHFDFFDLKGVVVALLEKAAANKFSFEATKNKEDLRSIFHPGLSALINSGGRTIGEIGAIHPRLAKEYDLPRLFFAELDLDLLFSRRQQKKSFIPLAKYPGSSRDFALIVDRSLNFSEIRKAILALNKQLISSVNIFDIYRGNQIPKDKVSLAIRVEFLAKEKTLKDEEIEQLAGQIIGLLKKKFAAEIR